MSKQRSAAEGDRLVRQLAWLIGGIIALFFVPFMIYAFYLDRRLSSPAAPRPAFPGFAIRVSSAV